MERFEVQSDVRAATPHIQDAVKSLLQAWDAVAVAEKILGVEITTFELQDLAGGLDGPESVSLKVTDAVISEWLETVRFGAK